MKRDVSLLLWLWLCLCASAVACGGVTDIPDSGSQNGGATGNNGGSSGGGTQSTGGGKEGSHCTLNSDCAGALVCIFAVCHAACAATKDCAPGQSCVKGVEGPVCQLATETACTYNSECGPPLVCASDHQCRNQCQATRDCLPAQTCASGVCVD